MNPLFICVLLSSKHFCVVVEPPRIFRGVNQLRCPFSLWKCLRWTPETTHALGRGTALRTCTPALPAGADGKQEVARRHGSARSYSCDRPGQETWFSQELQLCWAPKDPPTLRFPTEDPPEGSGNSLSSIHYFQYLWGNVFLCLNHNILFSLKTADEANAILGGNCCTSQNIKLSK